MVDGTGKGWSLKSFVVIGVLAVVSVCIVLACVYVGYYGESEWRFLSDAKRLRQQLPEEEFSRLFCSISSGRYGQAILSPEEAAPVREALMKVLDSPRMRPAYLGVTQHTIAATACISFHPTAEDAEHHENTVVWMMFYECPDAARIFAAERFQVREIDILLDDEIHAKVAESIKKVIPGGPQAEAPPPADQQETPSPNQDADEGPGESSASVSPH